MPSPFENLAGPGKPMAVEPPMVVPEPLEFEPDQVPEVETPELRLA